jgi:ATP-dependent exoDNAse (exonuclease V) beta subunit
MRDFVLEKLNYYDNNPLFEFKEKYHKYYYDGKDFTSVTSFLKRFKEEFDSEKWSKIKADEAGVDQEKILEEWKQKNDRANEIGHATHEWIENFFKGVYQPIPKDFEIIDRIDKFNKIYYEKLTKLVPIKFEQRLFSTKLKLAGTFDALFSYKDQLVIVDWKTNKKFDTSNSYGKKLLHPFEEEDECKLTEYSIQISLYALMLEEVGLDIKMGYILYIGPNGEPELHRFNDYRDKLRTYFVDLDKDV